MQIIKNLLSQKLNRDIAWTIGSFSILAMSGIIINLTIAGFRDSEALGVFNQTYAIYIVSSQIATFGIHYSVLRYAAYYESHLEERSKLLITAGLLALVLGGVFACIVFIASNYIGTLLESESTKIAIAYASIGLILFPLNKVLLSYLNGLRKMKAFSMLQASRYLSVMIWVAFIAATDVEFEYSAVGFFIAEVVTVTLGIIYIVITKLCSYWYIEVSWVRRHLEFGSKSLLSGMFVEMNSRIDVLLIGIFMSDYMVGIYSFAAMLIDGLYHILAMIKINFNPILVKATKDNNYKYSRNLLSKSIKYIYPVTSLLSLLTAMVFYFLATIVVPEKGLIAGIYPLFILLLGLTLISAFIPFDNLLLVSGYPAYQTMQHLIVVISNILLNITLVPIYGIEGAAVATSFSYIVGVLVLIIIVNKKLNWNLMFNTIKGLR